MLGTAGEVRKNSDEVLLCTPTDRLISVGWPAKTYVHQLFRGLTKSDGWRESRMSVLSACLDDDDDDNDDVHT